MNRITRGLISLDWALVLVPALLVSVGLVMIFTLGQAQNRPELFLSQLIYATMAVFVYGTAAAIDYRIWQNSAWLLYGLGILLLVLVLVIGQAQFGAQRWISLGSFQLQPAELMKAILLFGLARLLANRTGDIGWWRYGLVLGLAALPSLLVLAQPDLGSALVLIGLSIALLFASRLSRRELVASLLVVVVTLTLGWLSLRDYQRVRIESFLHRSRASQAANYNVEQSMIAVGSGGLTGAGIGRGSQSQLNFLPVAHTDFMFATFAEATGLLGASTLLLCYGLIIWRSWRIALLSRDSFAMLVGVGVGTVVLIQVGINVGMNIGLVPVAGIPLPLVSHGGSSLLVTALLLGILQSMYRRCARQRLVVS